MTTVAGLLLAAGAGRRYGMPKALVMHRSRVHGDELHGDAVHGDAVHGDELLVERGLRVLRDGGLAPLVVVLGAAVNDVLAAADLTGATVVRNDEWATGMGSSLRTGLRALEQAVDDLVGGPAEVDAVVVLLVDTPGITSGAVRRIAGAAAADALVAATYGGEQGHPVLLGRRHWSGVAALATGDRGARVYLREHAAELRLVPCDDIADGTDMDTPELGTSEVGSDRVPRSDNQT